jgi:hypothetical protein
LYWQGGHGCPSGRGRSCYGGANANNTGDGSTAMEQPPVMEQPKVMEVLPPITH